MQVVSLETCRPISSVQLMQMTEKRSPIDTDEVMAEKVESWVCSELGQLGIDASVEIAK